MKPTRKIERQKPKVSGPKTKQVSTNVKHVPNLRSMNSQTDRVVQQSVKLPSLGRSESATPKPRLDNDDYKQVPKKNTLP